MLLAQYYGTGHASLDNYIAMISGQAATPETRNDCQTYAEFALTGISSDGQAVGSGCVYPAQIKTVVDQLRAKGKTWRAYMGDMGNDPTREATVCGHPELNTVDHTQTAEPPSASVPLGDQYASRHNPFVYFHSIIDSEQCSQVVNLNRLKDDLNSPSLTPEFVFITPNLCDDGHDAPCVNGQPGGLVSADAFLETWIPLIESSAAYKEDGLIAIIFDEGGFTTTQNANAVTITFQGQYCCSEQPGRILGPFRNRVLLGRLRLLPATTAATVPAPCYCLRFLSPGRFQRYRSTTFHYSRPSRTFSISTAILAMPDSRDCCRFLTAYLPTFTLATLQIHRAASVIKQRLGKTEALEPLPRPLGANAGHGPIQLRMELGRDGARAGFLRFLDAWRTNS